MDFPTKSLEAVTCGPAALVLVVKLIETMVQAKLITDEDAERVMATANEQLARRYGFPQSARVVDALSKEMRAK